MKRNIYGVLKDETRYIIENDKLIINNKVWLIGSIKEIKKYIECLNNN